EVVVNPRYHIQSAFAAKGFIAARVTPKVAEGGASRGGITFGRVRGPVGKEIAAPPGLEGKTVCVDEGKVYFLVAGKVAGGVAAPAGEGGGGCTGGGAHD